jgi:hypothetical protein
VSEVLQTSLGIVLQWCDRTNLSINANKAVNNYSNNSFSAGSEQTDLHAKLRRREFKGNFEVFMPHRSLLWRTVVQNVQAGPGLWEYASLRYKCSYVHPPVRIEPGWRGSKPQRM